MFSERIRENPPNNGPDTRAYQRKKEGLHPIAARNECIKLEVAKFPEKKKDEERMARMWKDGSDGVSLEHLGAGTILYVYLFEKGRDPERFEVIGDGVIDPQIEREENIEIAGETYNVGKKLQPGNIISVGVDTATYNVDQIIVFYPKPKSEFSAAK